MNISVLVSSRSVNASLRAYKTVVATRECDGLRFRIVRYRIKGGREMWAKSLATGEWHKVRGIENE